MRFFEQQDQARARTRQLLLLFALAVLALVLAINAALAVTWRLVTPGFSSYPAYFFTVNTVMTLVFVLGGWWLETSSLHGGGEKLARRAGAREAWPASRLEEQKLCNIASELAIAASMAVPQVMVLDRVGSINAFAAGWDEDDAVIAVTRGALDGLTRDELQGLVAHELSHIREGDTRLNMRLAGMVFGLEMIFNLGVRMCERGDNGQRSALALPGLAIMAAGFLGWLAGRALKAAVWWRIAQSGQSPGRGGHAQPASGRSAHVAGSRRGQGALARLASTAGRAYSPHLWPVHADAE